MSGFVKAGFSFLKNLGKGQKTTGTEVIKSVKPNVPKTKLEKLKSQVKIATQKSKASQAKLDNTIFRINQQKKRLEREKKMGGGMMGRRFGMRSGTNPFKKETDVDKIKKTFAPKKGLKKIDPKKQKGLAKLKQERPDVVRKMGYMKRGGRA